MARKHLLLFGVVAVSGLFLTRTAVAQDPPAATVFPSWMARMYLRPNAVVWNAVQSVLKNSKLRTARVDNRRQFVTTQSVDLDPGRFGFGVEVLRPRPNVGLDVVSQGMGFARAQLLILVSPFVEPARVYVGSIVDARNATQYFRLYGVPEVGMWFLRPSPKMRR